MTLSKAVSENIILSKYVNERIAIVGATYVHIPRYMRAVNRRRDATEC